MFSTKIQYQSDRRTVLIAAHAWFADMYGGAFRVATELAIGLATEGWHVIYVCCNTGSDPDREILQGVDVRRYRIPSLSVSTPRFWQHIRGAYNLTRSISSEYDVVAVSGHSPLQYLGALRGLGNSKIRRCSYVVHSPFAEEQLAAAGPRKTDWKVRLRAAAGSLIDGWCLRRSTVAHCLSEFTSRTLSNRYGSSVADRCVECPGWVDVNQFRPVTDRRAIRAAMPEPWRTDETIFFTVRRLESRMGLDTLIDAASRVASHRPFRILIGGSGPDAARLSQAIASRGLSDRVHLLGRIPEEQLPLCYAASDAFVLPTRSLECFGLIVLEAFASGTPVIGSSVGAIPELLSYVGDEWMFEPGNADALADRLNSFLQGQLTSKADLREFACRYDVRRQMPRWIDLCVGSQKA